MKKCFQSFLSISLAVLLLFHCGIVAFAQDNTVTDTTQDITVTQETVNTLDMLKENIMTMCSDTDITLTVQAVKETYDFDGNLYYTVEFLNGGYMICHASSGERIEYSISAPSPYSGCTGQLYYCGPMNYFTAVGETCTHTITNNSFSMTDTEHMNTLADASEQLSNVCSGMPSAKKTARSAISDITVLEGASFDIKASSGGYYVPGSNKIKGLKDKNAIGYMNDGVCGYPRAYLTRAESAQLLYALAKRATR